MLDTMLTAARILIVDDQPSNVLLLEGILHEEDYTGCRSVIDSRQVLPVFLDYRPDLILLDLQMPYLDGFEVMKQLQGRAPTGDFLPILVLTADITPETKRRALAGGAMDFVENQQPVLVIVQVQFGLQEFGAVAFRFEIQVDAPAALRNPKSKRGLAHLTRPKQHNGGRLIKSITNRFGQSPGKHVCDYGTMTPDLHG